MARGNMKIDVLNYTSEPTILNRTEKEAIAMTIDFTSVDTKDPVTGEKVVKAGMPITKAGVPVKNTPFTGVVGILYRDVYESRPQGALLKKAYVHTKRAQDNSGCTYDAKLVAALVNAGCRIVFEEPDLAGTIPDAASVGG